MATLRWKQNHVSGLWNHSRTNSQTLPKFPSERSAPLSWAWTCLNNISSRFWCMKHEFKEMDFWWSSGVLGWQWVDWRGRMSKLQYMDLNSQFCWSWVLWRWQQQWEIQCQILGHLGSFPKTVTISYFQHTKTCIIWILYVSYKFLKYSFPKNVSRQY
jgi:hypothetical protein